MFDRFTDKAEKVIELAKEEAKKFNHEYIGTEHLLLGLVKNDMGAAANILQNLDIELRKVRFEVENIVQTGSDLNSIGLLPFKPIVTKVLKLSMDEADSLGHKYVGTEHLLLGLIRVQEDVTDQIFLNLGLTLEDVRKEIINGTLLEEFV